MTYLIIFATIQSNIQQFCLEEWHFIQAFCFRFSVKFSGAKSSTFNTTESGSRAGPGRSINMAVKSFTVSGLSLAEYLDFQEVGEGNCTVTGGKKM